jgi:hypothetical protein
MSIYTMPINPVTNGIVALAGGALTAATPVLSTGFNEVLTVVTANDSVVLPPAIMGASCLVHDMQATTATMKIYAGANPFNNNVVDGIIAHGAVVVTAGSTGVTLALGHTSLFVCTTQGQWKQVGDFA